MFVLKDTTRKNACVYGYNYKECLCLRIQLDRMFVFKDTTRQNVYV